MLPANHVMNFLYLSGLLYWTLENPTQEPVSNPKGYQDNGLEPATIYNKI